MMKAHDVPINDLHAQVWNNLDDYLSADQLHLSEAGVAACAQRVASAVSAQLARALIFIHQPQRLSRHSPTRHLGSTDG